MKFLIRFCGARTLIVLSLSYLVALTLDFVGIAVVFPFLSLFINPSLAHSNKVAARLYQWGGFTTDSRFVMAVGVVLIIGFFVKLVAKTLVNRIRFRVVNDVGHRLATRLFADLMGAEYALFTEQSTSEMVVIMNSHSIHSSICFESFTNVLNETLFLLLLGILFFVINPLMAAIIIGGLAVTNATVYFALASRIDKMGKRHAEYCTQVHRFGFAMANSIKDVKIMGLEAQYNNRFDELWLGYSGNMARSATVKAIPRDFAEFLVLGALVATCLVIAIHGYSLAAIVPMIGLMAVSAMRALPSFNNIVRGYNEYKYYRSSLAMVEGLFHEARERKQQIAHLNIPFERELAVTNLRFGYNGKTVLDNLTFVIGKGEAIAFVGASGVGKSTLLDVLAGLRNPTGGRFVLDGATFDPFGTDALKRKVGYVPQNVTLVDESVAFNIAFSHEYDRAKMSLMLRMAQLETFVAELPEGIDTLLGESGVRVSGGQRQRIGIARALYRNPEILIFDEATSALDTVTERELMQEINRLSGDKTVIIVAHRLSTVEHCTAIHLLESGKIIARGTQAELLQRSPEYRSMYRQQQSL